MTIEQPPESGVFGVQPWIYHNPDRALIELTGVDRLEWLQGQATNDLRSLPGSPPLAFCLCRATGQLEAICEAIDDGARTLVSTDMVGRDVMLRRVEAMVILEDVSATDLTGRYSAVWASGRSGHLPQPALTGYHSTAAGCTEYWVPTPMPLDRPEGLKVLTSEEFEWMRIAAGIPARGSDFDEKTLPPELGTDFERRHVSYAKGCYMGQEVLMRIHSRGHTNRRWMGLLLKGPAAPGDDVVFEGAVAGRVTSTASMNGRAFGAAMLRNQAAADGAQVLVRGNAALAHDFPLAVTSRLG